jgi:hypothetical protein
MSIEPPRMPPQSVIQATGQIASDVVGGLKSQPVLLGLLVLNAIGIAAACWFLSVLAESQSKRMDQILKACLPYISTPRKD